MFRFANPWMLLVLVAAALPIVGGILRERARRVPRLLYSETSVLRGLAPTLRARAASLLPFGQACAIALGALALARPQAGHRVEHITTEGIDIVVALDISGSMRAEDFAPKNRLYVAKKTIASFIAGRTADRIGLVTFAAASETRCPPTLDYDALQSSLSAVSFPSDPRDDGTAIGSGIATGVNRLRTSKAKSRVLILLTDGINNQGSIDPVTAADLAHAVGVRIYTIGVGSEGPVTIPIPDGTRVRATLPINEVELRRIAATTGGSYFRANDSEALAAIFRRIDGLEKTKIDVQSYGRYDELFGWFLAPSLALLALGFVGARTILSKVP